MKPLGKVKIQWSPEFAYAIGLLVTDGNLSPDGRHLTFVSKDREQIDNFMRCLEIKVKVGYTYSSYNGDPSFRVQFGDVQFYDFLLKIGVVPNKSKILRDIKIPKQFFFDFLRGHFDGDGTFYSYFDPRWKSSFMYYTIFISSSENHIHWIQKKLFHHIKIKGYLTFFSNKLRPSSWFQLRYAKKESLQLLSKLYYNDRVICLSRKRQKIEKALAIANEHI